MTLVLAALAVFWAWEFLLVLSPVRVPPFLQPPLVAGLGYLATLLSATVLFPAAIAGAVAILHALTRAETPTPVAFQMPRRTGRRSEVGGRIPPLP